MASGQALQDVPDRGEIIGVPDYHRPVRAGVDGGRGQLVEIYRG